MGLYLDGPHLACLGFPDYHSMDYEKLLQAILSSFYTKVPIQETTA